MKRFIKKSGSRRVGIAMVVATGMLGLSFSAGGDELAWDARTLFEESVATDLQLSADGDCIELDWGVLVEDDGPAAGFSHRPNEELLSPNVWIKKTLEVRDPRARAATLLIAPGGNPRFIINGRNQPLEASGKAGQYWQSYSLPPELLRHGSNDIVVGGSGRIWIARADEFAAGSDTRTEHPNRSAKSTDQGGTWDDVRLGPAGNVDGEYYVRLFLEQHRPKGRLLSPVIDVGNLSGKPVSPALDSLGPVRLSLDSRTGVAGTIATRVRTGTTLVPDPESWSDWQTMDSAAGTIERLAGRFLQFELELRTNDALASPALRRLTIACEARSAGDWTQRVRVAAARNPKIERSSIPFEYEPLDHPRLAELRRRYDLDAVVAGAKTEFELIERLAEWTSGLWARGHLGDAYPPWDALAILARHDDGTPVGGFCQQYNLVFLQACESFGLVGRAVSLGPGALVDKPRRGGHEVVEIWSNEHGKWVYVDGQFAWYACDAASGVPLSLWELRHRQLRVLAGQPAPATRIVRIGASSRGSWNGVDHEVPFGELRLIPRSDFLTRRAPLPLNQGMRGWFWTGHYVWTDSELPAALLYGHRVTRRDHWEWSLNQVHYLLEATKTPGQVRVHLDTQTPSFETFRARIDEEKPQPVSSGFLWQLRPGTNRLAVWSCNCTGRPGPESWIVLDVDGS